MEERFVNFLMTGPKKKIIEFLKRVKELNEPIFDEFIDLVEKNI